MIEDQEIAKIQKKKMSEMLERAREQTQPRTIIDREPIALTDANFSSEVNQKKLILVDFWAPWCGPCRAVGPIIEELASEYAGMVTFGKMNVDENPMVPQTFGVQGIPTMILFKDGKAVDSMVGACPKSTIESRFKRYL